MSQSKKFKTNSSRFLKNKNIDPSGCLIRNSKLWDNIAPEDWWFRFPQKKLKEFQFLLLCGALDKENRNFRVFRVPVSYLKENIHKVDLRNEGDIHLAITKEGNFDVRAKAHKLSFAKFIAV